MKAAVWHGHKDVRIEEKEIPRAYYGQVVIKVAYAGICGTDRHEYMGPNFIPVKTPHRLTGKTAPLTLGHEFSGWITEVGEGVSEFKVDDRVTANGSLACNECEFCKQGRFNICEKLGFLGVGLDGAFAEYVSVEASKLFKIPDNLSLKEAVLSEPLACGAHAVSIVGDMKDKNIVVIGSGVIGLSAFFAAKEAGAGKIIVTGIGTARKALIEKYGGSYVDVSHKNLSQEVLHLFDGKLADVVFECVGYQSTLDSGIEVLKHGGSLMVMGVFEKPPVFPMNFFQEGERKLYTSQAFTTEMANTLAQLSQGKIDGNGLITKEIELKDIVKEGFEELLENGAEHIKIIIRINEEKEKLEWKE